MNKEIKSASGEKHIAIRFRGGITSSLVNMERKKRPEKEKMALNAKIKKQQIEGKEG